MDIKQTSVVIIGKACAAGMLAEIVFPRKKREHAEKIDRISVGKFVDFTGGGELALPKRIYPAHYRELYMCGKV